MAWAQFIPMAMQAVGGIFDMQAGKADAQTQKAMGYATANANESRIRAHSAQQLGTMRAAQVEGGFDPSSGSALSLQSESAANAELDALTERYKGQLTAWQADQSILRQKDKMSFLFDPLGGTSFGKASSILTNGGVTYGLGKAARKL